MVDNKINLDSLESIIKVKPEEFQKTIIYSERQLADHILRVKARM